MSTSAREDVMGAPVRSSIQPYCPAGLFSRNTYRPSGVKIRSMATVLRALRASPNPIAASIAESIARDAKEYPAAVKRDSAIVLEAARRLGIDLLLFTN